MKHTAIITFLLILSIFSAFSQEKEVEKSLWNFEPVPAAARDSFFARERAAHVLADPGYRIWGLAAIKWSDGKYHAYYARWKEELGHDAWLTDCEIAHAVADRPEGPFNFVNVVLHSRNENGWDMINSHNPAVCVADGKICLYYISNDLRGKFDNMQLQTPEERRKNRDLFRNNQRIGVAVATDPAGPFVRSEKPVVEPDNQVFKNIAVNPAVTFVDGKYVMIMKGDQPTNDGWFRIQLAGSADKPEGPFKFNTEPVYNKVQTEDAGIWYDQTAKTYYMTCHVMGARDLALFSSADGNSWQIHDKIFTHKSIPLDDGSTWNPQRVERPFVLTDENGKPICLYVAVADNDINGNIAIRMNQK